MRLHECRSHLLVFVATTVLATVAVAVPPKNGPSVPLPEVSSSQQVTGYVFEDTNRNGILDRGERGVPYAVVSNGREVTMTDRSGQYFLPAYDEMVVFVTKPSGYATPLDENNFPKFYYVHQPAGSPASIAKYKGLSPTGELPKQVNFPLYRANETHKFKALITGDLQPYNQGEIDFLRDSFVREAAGVESEFVIALGDNVGDNLSLYPRLQNVLKGAGRPIYFVPGNHDRNYDSPDGAHCFDTYKRQFGPPYYSFNYGDAHFVVLESVIHDGAKKYHGAIDDTQLAWLATDLAYVPQDRLIVLNMHIPISDFTEASAAKAVYDVLKGRKVVALAGHTHTLEHLRAGEEDPNGLRTPFPQIIAGAACGAWWSGDLDEAGVPVSYQSDGAPRGFEILEFDGRSYVDNFKATGKSASKQMNLSLLTTSFKNWYGQIWGWVNADSSTRPASPPLTLADLPNQGVISLRDLADTKLIANVWNGSTASTVTCSFDGNSQVPAVLTRDLGDPYVNRLQGFLFETSRPATVSYHVTDSSHLWTCDLPRNLGPGTHRATVSEVDMFGRAHYDWIVFEITK